MSQIMRKSEEFKKHNKSILHSSPHNHVDKLNCDLIINPAVSGPQFHTPGYLTPPATAPPRLVLVTKPNCYCLLFLFKKRHGEFENRTVCIFISLSCECFKEHVK